MLREVEKGGGQSEKEWGREGEWARVGRSGGEREIGVENKKRVGIERVFYRRVT